MRAWVPWLVAGWLAACGGDKKKDGGATGSTGTPPATASARRPIDAARAEALAARPVPGFTVGNHQARGAMVLVVVEAATPLASGAKVGAMITLGPCEYCPPLDVDAWRANPDLKMSLPRAHLDNPAALWAVDPIDLGGKRGISTYSLSVVEGASSHGLTAHYHDGVNTISIQTYAHDGPAATRPEDLTAWATKADFVAAAQQIFAAYAADFGP